MSPASEQLQFFRPANKIDLAECATTTTLQIWSMAQVQVKLGPSWALRTAHGATIACGGIVATDEMHKGECWFMAAAPASRHMAAVIAACRRCLTAISPFYSAITVSVSTPEGRRIAKALGFGFLETNTNGVEVWAHGTFRRRIERR